MNDLCIDAGYRSLNKYGEQLCGDRVQLVKEDDTTILVLADGLGSGVKANILATLTSKIISTMIAEKMTIEECVTTIMATLPVCQVRDIAYSTFTIIKITNNRYVEMIQYDNPPVILIRNGKRYEYPMETRTIHGKKILETKLEVQQNDIFMAMSDGAIYAGVGQHLNYGWQRENIIDYVETNYDDKMSAQAFTLFVLDACNELYGRMPGDDTTIATIQVRKREAVNLMFGPPKDPKDVNNMMSLFFAKKGKHIVSGGTTSTLTAEYLGKKLETSIQYEDPNVPPIAFIEGIDLVTEGVLTINRVLEYAKDYNGENHLYQQWHTKKDGASLIAKMLFENATDINFYVGKAINPAHQNPNLPIGFHIKMQLIEELSQTLTAMGKTVNVSYF